MNITTKQIADFRAKTGIAMMDCKNALIEANGNEERAIEILRVKGIAKAEKRANRSTKAGVIGSYVHNGDKIAVLVEVLSETDFVAKNDEFKSFVHDVAMHIAAMNPKYVSKNDIPQEEIEKEKRVLKEELAASGKPKPENIMEKIITGKMEKYFSEICLLNQVFVKDSDITIGELLNRTIMKIGENIVISKFVRMEVGS
jgi:elongation factor Ts